MFESDVVGGFTSELSLEVGDAIWQCDGIITLASNDSEHSCIGIIVYELDGKFYHIRHGVINNVSVEGSKVDDRVWLGQDGKLTYEQPSRGIVQCVGFMIDETTLLANVGNDYYTIEGPQ